MYSLKFDSSNQRAVNLESLFSLIFKNSFFSTFGKLGVKALSFAFTIIVIRWLGDEGYGRYLLIWSYVTLFAMLSDAGLGMFIIRKVAKNDADSHNIVGNIVVIRIILSVVTIGIIMTALAVLDFSNQFRLQVLFASTILILYAIQDPLDALLQAHERFDLATASVLSGQVIFIASGALFLTLGWGIGGLIGAGLLNVVVSALFAAAFLRFGYQQSMGWDLQPRQWLGYLRESFSFGLIKLWLSWSSRLGILVLSWFWVEEIVGWYGAAQAIILGFVVISNAVNAALYPTLSRQHAEMPRSLQRVYDFAIKYLLLIALPIAGGVFITAETWVSLLYNSEFSSSAIVLSVLIWVVPLTFVSEFLRYVLMATNRERSIVRYLGFTVLISIGLYLWFIPLYGLIAAAAVSLATEAILIMFYLQKLSQEFDIKPSMQAVGKLILATAIMMGIVAVTTPLGLIWQIIFGAVSYTLSIWILQIVHSREYVLFFGLLSRSEKSYQP